ncbi:hypothetical protein LCGC14_2424110, partial [marine sediment metagenome]
MGPLRVSPQQRLRINKDKQRITNHKARLCQLLQGAPDARADGREGGYRERRRRPCVGQATSRFPRFLHSEPQVWGATSLG